ncbi:MAG TPA: exodeoxyribonuclease VII large subunit [Pirellulaceae bacterium]|nr:exodeoxyribonuclease VII large subunit [Pirellulaceae bacterium]
MSQIPSTSPPPASDEPQVLSVSDLTLAIKSQLERDFTSVWVSGELSDVSRPQSGHVYLTLKDAGAQIRGVIWKSVAARIKFDLADGLAVVCRGDIDVYPARGSYQLVIRQVEPLGVGALQLAFKKLYDKLSAEGLFDPRHKRPLPRFPRRIAFVTSPTGAAIRDFLEVVRRRWQGVEVLIIPARVQGEGAALEIARGIQLANELAVPPDVLVVGRGGGSIEDLWCFNEEPVVRAIYASHIPVVSAVGHEIDVTLADLVADVRALTPSEAAERIVPAADEVLATLRNFQQRLTASLRAQAQRARQQLDSLAQRRCFRRPFDAVQQHARLIDELDQRARRAMGQRVLRSREKLASLTAHLEGLSPLGVLSRGYSLTTRTSSGELLRDANQVDVGELLTTRLTHGELTSRVEKITRETQSPTPQH